MTRRCKCGCGRPLAVRDGGRGRQIEYDLNCLERRKSERLKRQRQERKAAVWNVTCRCGAPVPYRKTGSGRQKKLCDACIGTGDLNKRRRRGTIITQEGTTP
jgi:hypothetical protein